MTVKNIIATLICLALCIVMYVGAYLPIRKSQLYIAARAEKVQSLEEFNNAFDPALDFYSPVGQDELVANYLDIVVNAMNGLTNEDLIRLLTQQAENHALPVVSRGVGFGLSQITNGLGTIYQIAAYKLQSKEYHDKAVETMKLGLTFSPNRKVFLTGLLNLYGSVGDVVNAKEMANAILKYYPNDPEAMLALQQISGIEKNQTGQ